MKIAYDNNLLGIKDFTEGVGQMIDDAGKILSNMFNFGG